MKKKLFRITTVPISLEKLLENQLRFMNGFYEITAISSDKPRLERFGEDQGVKTYHIELTRKITPLKDLKSLFKLYRFLRKEKPLIVHTHTPKAGVIGMLASYLAKTPIRLHTVAGLPLLEAKGFKRRILNAVERITYKCATQVYPNSHGLKQIILEEKLIKKSEKLKVLGNGSSNGIDVDYFDPDLFGDDYRKKFKDELSFDANDFVFVFVGRVVRDKGINELIAAFLKMQRKQTKLLLVGPLESELDPLTPETLNQITNNPSIKHVGFQKDIRPYLAVSDVLVFPSYREGFPNVVMQAGAMGLPSIVSNINGCNEIISDKQNGLIIPVKDITAIFEAMKRTLEDPNMLNVLKENARSSIVDSYKREDMWKFILAEYQKLEGNV